MALSLAQAFEAAHLARKLESASLARTLTNNQSATVIAALEAAAAATVAGLGGTVVPSTSAVIADGVALVKPVTGTYVDTITPTIVAGVITGFVLS